MNGPGMEKVIKDTPADSVDDLKLRINKLERYIEKVRARIKRHETEWQRERELTEKDKKLVKQGMDILKIKEQKKSKA